MVLVDSEIWREILVCCLEMRSWCFPDNLDSPDERETKTPQTLVTQATGKGQWLIESSQVCLEGSFR